MRDLRHSGLAPTSWPRDIEFTEQDTQAVGRATGKPRPSPPLASSAFLCDLRVAAWVAGKTPQKDHSLHRGQRLTPWPLWCVEHCLGVVRPRKHTCCHAGAAPRANPCLGAPAAATPRRYQPAGSASGTSPLFTCGAPGVERPSAMVCFSAWINDRAMSGCFSTRLWYSPGSSSRW